MTLPLPFHSYDRPNVKLRLINMFAEAQSGQEKGKIQLIRSPGTVEFADTQGGACRGGAMHKGVLHVVAGAKLYSISDGGTVAELGTIPGGNPVDMVSDGVRLAITTKPDMYFFETDVQQVTDPDFPGASKAVFLDGFTIFIEPDSGRFHAFELLDIGNLDALDFATAEGLPDNLVSVIADHRQLILLGETSTEFWYTAGGAGFPFARAPNGYLEIGCAARLSVAKADNSFFWMAKSEREGLTVRRLQGLTPQDVSNAGVVSQWEGYSRVDDAEGFTYGQDDHIFYVLNFPTANATWVYDISTGEWHERGSGLGFNVWRAIAYFRAYNKHLVLDRLSGKIGELKTDMYTEYGGFLKGLWTYQSVYAQAQRAFHKSLEIRLRTGDGGDPEPQMMMEISEDGGQSFRHLNPRTLGKVGERSKRVRWTGLGSSRDRVYRGSVSDDVAVEIYDTQLNVEGGRV